MKYCCDCRFIFKVLPGQRHPECLRFRERVELEDPVHGITVHHTSSFCDLERAEDGRCGPDAKEWRERPQVTATKPANIKWFKGWFA